MNTTSVVYMLPRLDIVTEVVTPVHHSKAMYALSAVDTVSCFVQEACVQPAVTCKVYFSPLKEKLYPSRFEHATPY